MRRRRPGADPDGGRRDLRSSGDQPFTRAASAPTVDGWKGEWHGRLRRRAPGEPGYDTGAPIMSPTLSLRAEMVQIAAAAGSVERRADALLGCLRGVIPYAAG